MKTWGLLIAILALCTLSTSCRTKKAMEQEITDENLRNVIQSPLPQRNLHLAFDLLKALPEYKENFVISPFSISTALAMTYAGAREETSRQMVETLYFHPHQDSFHPEFSRYISQLREMAADTIQLNIANSLWVQKDYQFRQEFFEQVETNYGSLLQEVDFRGDREAIRTNINQWVLDETREKIENLIAPGVLSRDTRMVLVNAIHFFGPWKAEFDKELTRDDIFTTMEGQKRRTPFMFRSERLPYLENETMQVLELPYSGGQYSMIIMLPKKDIQLSEMEAQINAEDFLAILSEMEVPDMELDLFIPRFKAETKTDLEETLSQMGMPLAFSDQADLSGMTDKNDLKIDKVIHQAMIEVAEQGTEAAAATAVIVVLKTTAEPQERIRFKADRPFLFFIKDNRYNSVLFLGRMNDPE